MREREEKKTKIFAPEVPDVDVAEPRVDVAVVEDVAVDEVEGVGEVLDVAEPRKGQLISKCLFAVIISTKNSNGKIYKDFCPEIFCSFLEASWKLFGDLVSNIIN